MTPIRHSVRKVARKSVVPRSYLAVADRYLDECFAAGTPPHVNEFARTAGISRRSLGRAFATEAGMSVAAYFKKARVRRALELLQSTDLAMDAVAQAAGFGTRVTFFRAFKGAIGLTPEAYRTRHR